MLLIWDPSRIDSYKFFFCLFFRWGIVIHGGIDGFSRFITFLRASDNNYAQTVAISFNEAIRQHGIPSRLRTDRGGENSIIGTIMETIRGEGRGSWLRGPSVHNQRIERLWRDLRSFCTNFFIALFCRMENNGIYIPDSNIHRFSLHYVFLPRLNRALDEFTLSYNNHGIRTMRGRTPSQIFVSGIMSNYNSNYVHVREQLNGTSPDIDLNEFGVTATYRSEANVGEDSVVNVARPTLEITEENYNRLIERLQEYVPDVNGECHDHGLAFYMLTLLHVNDFMNSLDE